MKITYLYHSGFAVETSDHFLIFDYWRNSPMGGNLSNGVINPDEIKDRDVIVFSSHRHKDHYNSVIHTWQKTIKKFRVVLSNDINKVEGVKMVAPNMVYNENDYILKTFLSNDEGVAFFLDIDGVHIYHAGDLNWWHWEGEEGSWNDDIKKSYQKEIGLIAEEEMDIAFITLDPRLNDQYCWGLDYFARNTKTNYIVPMHMAERIRLLSVC